ncbi:hypothetical protein CBS101457_001817 [Exobasidium rhododendri]|nr:hypothetical protein CBS101457_001817 [Exobasidium rhododendri]
MKSPTILLHLDAWLEGTILEAVKNGPVDRIQKKSQSTAAIGLEQISVLLHKDIEEGSSKGGTDTPAHYTFVKNEILHQNPGEREMIRRAARRLVILDPETWAYTQHLGPCEQRVTLTQEKGKKILRTLQDVSFAKGEMYVQLRKLHD